MNGRCDNDPLDEAVDVCDMCYGEFCAPCLLRTRTRKHPLCRDCALVASGIKGSTTRRPRGSRRTAKRRRKELAENRTQANKGFHYFDEPGPSTSPESESGAPEHDLQDDQIDDDSLLGPLQVVGQGSAIARLTKQRADDYLDYPPPPSLPAPEQPPQPPQPPQSLSRPTPIDGVGTGQPDEPEAQPEAATRLEPELEPQPEPESLNRLEPELEPQPEPESLTRLEPELEPQPEPELEPQPEPELEPQPEPESQPDPQATTAEDREGDERRALPRTHNPGRRQSDKDGVPYWEIEPVSRLAPFFGEVKRVGGRRALDKLPIVIRQSADPEAESTNL